MPKYKTIHICYSDKNKIPKYIYTNLKNLNPDYDIKFYGNKECYDFLLEYFSKNYANFFDNIPDGPIKADFWRVCILYIFGGVYLDIDVKLLKPLDFIIPDDISFLTSTSRCMTCLNPIIIYSKPRNILLYNTILGLYENKKKKYSYWVYSVCPKIIF
jgi:mannosyltransferase OCH1-like enzyme